MIRRIASIFAIGLTCAFASFATAARAQEPRTREIVQVRGHVYRIQYGDAATVCFVGADAILLADPLNPTAATWIRAELATRFPGRTIRFVVQTYPSFERAGGGLLFRPEATIVGHERFNKTLREMEATLPPSVRGLDQNRDQVLDPAELANTPLRADLLTYDVNGDGTLRSSELYGAVAQARAIYVMRTIVDVSGHKIEILNPTPAYRSDTSAILFPEERVLFSAGSPVITDAAPAFKGHNARDVLQWMHAIAPLAFDLAVSGTGAVMPRADFDTLLHYLDDLRTTAVAAYSAGLPIADSLDAPLLLPYRGTPVDASRIANLRALHDTLVVYETEIVAGASVKWISSNGAYCDSFTNCTAGGFVPVGTGGLRLTAGRYGGMLELAFGGQVTASRESALYDDAFAFRGSRGSLLVRRGGREPAERSTDWLAGISLTVGDSKGLDRVKDAVAPFGGRHPLSQRAVDFGFTGGADYVRPLRNHRKLIVPIRVTISPFAPTDLWPGRLDAQIGVGFSFTVNQQFR